LVDEDIARAGLTRIQPDLRVAVLPAAAGLPDVASFAFGLLGQRFLVGDLRLADAGLYAKLALASIHLDFQVQLPHAGDDRLAGLRIGLDAEGGILGDELLESLAELFLIGLGLRLDRE